MRKNLKVLVAGVAAVVVVGALAVGSVAAQAPLGGPGGMHQAVIARVASTLGVTEAKLNEAFAQAHDQALDDAVKAGQLTQAQADWMKQRHAAMAQGGFGPGAGMMGPGMMGGWGYSPFGWIGMLFMWLIPVGFLVLTVLGIVWLVRTLGSGNTPPAPTKICPSCGRGVQADWRNCPYCGTTLASQ